MKNNTFLKFFIIFLVAILFRFCFLDKPSGLWNDEYISWYIASQQDFHTFLEKVFSNCHTPLYYFYLKFWLFFFPDTDLSLRVSSVLPSLASIVTMFYLGKEVKDNNAGLLCALFTAVSSFNVYFAQEVRLYSLLFLLSSLSVLYFIKSLKNQTKKNLIVFFIIQALIIATHTLGIIYSFFGILFLVIYLKKKTDFFTELKDSTISLIKYIAPFIVTLLVLTPLLVTITTSKNISQFWTSFSITKIVYTFVDYFSPIQVNLTNSANSFISYFYTNNHLNYMFILLAIIPTIIGFYAVYKAVKVRDLHINIVGFQSLLFFSVLVILSILGKMVLTTKYSVEIYPTLILMFSVGILAISGEKLRNALLSFFVIAHLFYLTMSAEAVQFRTRPEGNKLVYELINQSRLTKDDFILLTYYDIDRFERYIHNKEDFNILSVNKYNFNYMIFNSEPANELNQNGKTLYRDYFLEFPNKKIQEYARDFIILKMHKGQKVGVVLLTTVSFLTTDEIKEIFEDKKRLKETPFIYLVFSTLKNNILYAFKDGYKVDSVTDIGDWALVVFEKT